MTRIGVPPGQTLSWGSQEMCGGQTLLSTVSGHRGATTGKPVFAKCLQCTWPSRGGATCVVALGVTRRRGHSPQGSDPAAK